MVKECYFCGSPKETQIHHIDCKHKNNSPNNLVRLCQKCHVAIHKYYGKSDMSEIRKIKKLGTMKYLK